jgi:hypothetical protein
MSEVQTSLPDVPGVAEAVASGLLELWMSLRPAERAVLVLGLRRDWPTSRIARVVGVRRETLSRSPLFRTARARARASEGGRILRGYKTGDGAIEAVADDGADDAWE